LRQWDEGERSITNFCKALPLKHVHVGQRREDRSQCPRTPGRGVHCAFAFREPSLGRRKQALNPSHAQTDGEASQCHVDAYKNLCLLFLAQRLQCSVVSNLRCSQSSLHLTSRSFSASKQCVRPQAPALMPPLGFGCTNAVEPVAWKRGFEYPFTLNSRTRREDRITKATALTQEKLLGCLLRKGRLRATLQFSVLEIQTSPEKS
jgi:hypothetical protein